MNLAEWSRLEAVSKAVGLKGQCIDAAEDEAFFSIAYQKDLVARQKRAYFRNRTAAIRLAVVVNPTNLCNVAGTVAGKPVLRLEEEFFHGFDTSSLGHLKALEDTVVVMTNNNLAKIHPDKFALIVEATPKTIYAIHDYDCHHWHELSIQAAILADAYFPAHPVDHSLAVRVNPHVIRGVPCGSIQWTNDFLSSRLSQLATLQRSDAPLGRHFYYGRFKYRNRVIATLGKQSSDTGIQTGSFHQLSQEDRWLDWASHKLHWVVPVQDDLPIRFFDALVTGGIPLVPTGLVDYVRSLGLGEHCLSYSPADILDPSALVARALHEFDSGGKIGIARRFVDGMRSGHIDRIVERIFSKSIGVYGEG